MFLLVPCRLLPGIYMKKLKDNSSLMVTWTLGNSHYEANLLWLNLVDKKYNNNNNNYNNN